LPTSAHIVFITPTKAVVKFYKKDRKLFFHPSLPSCFLSLSWQGRVSKECYSRACCGNKAWSS